VTEQAISPLRRRMIEDMTIRKFAQKTQHDYVRRVKEFASYLKRSPDTAKPEDVRGFQLHLTSSGAGTPKINAARAHFGAAWGYRRTVGCSSVASRWLKRNCVSASCRCRRWHWLAVLRIKAT
jgi:hypothetical protein